jgi:glutamyl-tRNA reductase
MQVFVFGVNHTTATVDIRERLNFAPEQIPYALHELVQHTCVREVVILSTCNRTELYCAIDSDDFDSVIIWLAHYHHMQVEVLRQYLYLHHADDAVRHLLRVACGLDSMVLGEPQILGQLKSAYQLAQENHSVGMLLSKLFQFSFCTAKQIRTDTAIGSSPISVAFAAVRLAQQIFGDLSKRTALLIGAGETIELAARHLKENGLGRMIVANRTLERARQLAMEMGGYAITLPEIPLHLAEADVVIASTASTEPILTYAHVKQAIVTRKHRPMFMVDIAVPRDIERRVGELEDVYLYTVDDLNEVIQENLRSRAQAAQQAEEMIANHVSHFMAWLQSRGAVNTIAAMRDYSENLRAEVLDKALRLLKRGKSPEEALQFLAHTLTNKFLHVPCVQLRQAGYSGNDEVIIHARTLFQLPIEDSVSSDKCLT